MPLFSSSDIKPIPKKEKKLLSAAASKSALAMVNYDALKDIEMLLDARETISFWTHGKWSQHDLLALLCRWSGGGIVYLCTWQISEEAVRILGELKNTGIIKELHCVFDYRIKNRKPKPFQLMQHYADSHVLTQIHAKVFTIVGDNPIAVVSSANLSKNRRIEAGTLFFDDTIVNFYKNNIEHELISNRTE